MRNTSPSCPPHAARSSSSAGLKRSTCPTAAWTPGLAHGRDDRRRLLRGRRERLLDEDVDTRAPPARRPRRGAPRWAPRRWRSPGGRARAARRRTRRSRHGSAHGAVSVAAGIHGAREVDPRRGLQQARVVAADHAQAEDGAAQRSGDCGGGGHGRLGYRPMGQTPPGLVVAPTATVGRDVTFGAHVVVHAGVVIGDGVRDPGRASCSASRPPLSRRVVRAPRRPASRSSSRRARPSAPRRSSSPALGSAPARSSATRRTSASARASAPTRWSAVATTVDNDVVIGERVRLQSNVYITAFTVIERRRLRRPVRDDDERRHDGAPLAGRPAGGRPPAPRVPGRRRRGARARASRSARRRSSPRARSSRATSRRARS